MLLRVGARPIKPDGRWEYRSKLGQKSSKGYGDDEIEGLFTLPSLVFGDFGKVASSMHAMSPVPRHNLNLFFYQVAITHILSHTQLMLFATLASNT